jgi:hypothetical protein
LQVLVTFCNTVAAPESSFALVDLATGYVRELPFGYHIADFGVTGLLRLPDSTLALTLPGTHRVLRLGPDLSITGQYVDPLIDDPHSLAARGDSLFLSSAGKDAVLELRPAERGFEKAGHFDLTSAGRDTLHVNSVCIHEGELLASVFGQDWRDHPVGTPLGAVISIERREVLTGGLRQPHTLVSHSGDLYILESLTGSVIRIHEDGATDVCVKHAGYLRGLTFFDGGALVGVSGGRRRSRGLGTLNVQTTHDPHRSGLLVYTPDWQLEEFHDLSWFGSEIYDVLLLEEETAPPTIEETLHAAKHRATQLQGTWEAPPEGPRPPGP